MSTTRTRNGLVYQLRDDARCWDAQAAEDQVTRDAAALMYQATGRLLAGIGIVAVLVVIAHAAFS